MNIKTLNASYITDFKVFNHAEYLALERNGNYPDIYPWLNKK